MTVLSTYFVLLLLRAFLFLFSKRQTPRGACREPLFSLSDSPYVFVLPSRGRSSERNGLYLMLTAFSGPGIIAHSQRFGRKPGQELVCEHRFHTLSAHEHISKTSSKKQTITKRYFDHASRNSFASLPICCGFASLSFS